MTGIFRGRGRTPTVRQSAAERLSALHYRPETVLLEHHEGSEHLGETFNNPATLFNEHFATFHECQSET